MMQVTDCLQENASLYLQMIENEPTFDVDD